MYSKETRLGFSFLTLREFAGSVRWEKGLVKNSKHTACIHPAETTGGSPRGTNWYDEVKKLFKTENLPHKSVTLYNNKFGNKLRSFICFLTAANVLWGKLEGSRSNLGVEPRTYGLCVCVSVYHSFVCFKATIMEGYRQKYWKWSYLKHTLEVSTLVVS